MVQITPGIWGRSGPGALKATRQNLCSKTGAMPQIGLRQRIVLNGSSDQNGRAATLQCPQIGCQICQRIIYARYQVRVRTGPEKRGQRIPMRRQKNAQPTVGAQVASGEQGIDSIMRWPGLLAKTGSKGFSDQGSIGS